MMTEQDIVDRLRWRIEQSSCRAVAKAAGVSPQFVSDCKAGRRPVTGELLAWLGYRAETVYRRRKERA